METLIVRLKLAFEKNNISSKGYPFHKLSERQLEIEAAHWEARAATANSGPPKPRPFALDARQPGQGPVFFHCGGGNHVLRKVRDMS